MLFFLRNLAGKFILQTKLFRRLLYVFAGKLNSFFFVSLNWSIIYCVTFVIDERFSAICLVGKIIFGTIFQLTE